MNNRVAKKKIVFDVSELFFYANGRVKYYGISRVVAEVAKALFLDHPDVALAIYSPGHRKFFELSPILIEQSKYGVDFGLPSISPIRMRTLMKDETLFTSVIRRLTWQVSKPLNRRRWARSGTNLQPIDMNGVALVSVGRPKLMPDMLRALQESKTEIAFHPMLHDFIPLVSYQKGNQLHTYQNKFLMDNLAAISVAAHVLTVSNFTKSEMERLTNEGVLPAVQEITAVPLVHECAEGTEAPVIELPQEPYFLVVGTSVGNKNIECVFNALLDLNNQDLDVPLLALAGKRRDDVTACITLEKYAPIRDRVQFIENPNQTDLVRLYKNAVALVIASRIEGWGLPAAEALWLGTPTICSDIDIFHEVCGDLGLYFNPNSPRELADIMDRMRNDKEMVTEQRARIAAAHGKMRRWSDVATDIVVAVEKFHNR